MPGTRGNIVYDFGKLRINSASIHGLFYFYLFITGGLITVMCPAKSLIYTVLFNVKSIMIQILHITTNSNLYYILHFP